MTQHQIEAIKRYVEEDVKAFLTAHKDIKDVQYRHRGSTGDSFLKITTAFGMAKYFDVTRLDEDDICKLICVVIVGGSPKLAINDLEAIREVEELFSK